MNSVLDYATVTSIRGSQATASTVTVGTGSLAASPWIRLDEMGAAAIVGIQCVVTGTANYTVQGTFDDPNDLISPVAPALMTWDSTAVPAALVGASSTQSNSINPAPLWIRTLLNSGAGSVKSVFTQYQQIPE